MLQLEHKKTAREKSRSDNMQVIMSSIIPLFPLACIIMRNELYNSIIFTGYKVLKEIMKEDSKR